MHEWASLLAGIFQLYGPGSGRSGGLLYRFDLATGGAGVGVPASYIHYSIHTPTQIDN